MDNIERFLLEMGDGFAVVGRQRHLEVGGQDQAAASKTGWLFGYLAPK